jgi:hypothetical protein
MLRAGLYLRQLNFPFFIAVGNLIRKERKIAAKNDMRSEEDNWRREVGAVAHLLSHLQHTRLGFLTHTLSTVQYTVNRSNRNF